MSENHIFQEKSKKYKKLYKKEVIKNSELLKKIAELEKEIKLLTPKGSLCSKNGNKYEKDVYNVVKNTYLNNVLFNTQKETELAGSTAKNDIECNFKSKKDIGIEIKKYNTPDWMQCSIKYNEEINTWQPTIRGRVPRCREIFENLIKDLELYNGDIPPFMKKSITHEEWLNIKKETDKWDDCYIDIPNITIKELYKAKGCYYIQISNGYGLFHLGEDICNFGVPEFIIEQQLRIRTKIHARKNKQGY